MRTGLIGKKIGSSSHFEENGTMSHISLIQIQDCVVSKIKTKEKHGYNAVQLASIEANKDCLFISNKCTFLLNFFL